MWQDVPFLNQKHQMQRETMTTEERSRNQWLSESYSIASYFLSLDEALPFNHFLIYSRTSLKSLYLVFPSLLLKEPTTAVVLTLGPPDVLVLQLPEILASRGGGEGFWEL